MAREHETTADSYVVTWTVEPGGDGKRLDHFLKEKYRKLSREYLQKAIKNGRVTLNQESSKPSRILKVGEKINVLSTRGKEPKVDFGYTVLFEDEHIVVIDKPGNLPVHPTGRYFFHTLLTQLRVENGNRNKEPEERVLHRAPDRPRDERRTRDRKKPGRRRGSHGTMGAARDFERIPRDREGQSGAGPARNRALLLAATPARRSA